MVALVERTAGGVDLHKKTSRPRERGTSRRCCNGTPKAWATDRQIEALVYELYGLSDEEIAVVEGSSHSWRNRSSVALSNGSRPAVRLASQA